MKMGLKGRVISWTKVRGIKTAKENKPGNSGTCYDCFLMPLMNFVVIFRRRFNVNLLVSTVPPVSETIFIIFIRGNYSNPTAIGQRTVLIPRNRYQTLSSVKVPSRKIESKLVIFF